MLEKAPPAPLPPARTAYSAGIYLRRLGIMLSAIAKTDADEESAHARVTKRFAERRQRQLTRAIVLAAPLREYAESNRQGSALSIDHAGKFDWIRRPSVVVHDLARAIAAIKRRGKATAKRLLRIRIEINKHAVHNDPDAVKGIRSLTIEHSDVLKIKPDESAYALEYNRKSGEYALSKPRKREAAEEE